MKYLNHIIKGITLKLLLCSITTFILNNKSYAIHTYLGNDRFFTIGPMLHYYPEEKKISFGIEGAIFPVIGYTINGHPINSIDFGLEIYKKRVIIYTEYQFMLYLPNLVATFGLMGHFSESGIKVGFQGGAWSNIISYFLPINIRIRKELNNEPDTRSVFPAIGTFLKYPMIIGKWSNLYVK